MPFRTWLFIAAIGVALSAGTGTAQEPSGATLEDEPIIGVGDAQGGIEGEQPAADQQSGAADLAPFLQGIESAIRDTIALENEAERERRQQNEERDLYAQEEMAFWAKGMFWATVVAVMLTLAALIAIIRTLHHTRRAADSAYDMVLEAKLATVAAQDAVAETRRIGEAQVRAYLSIEELKMRIGDRGSVMIHIKCRNLGQSPAKDVMAISAISIGHLTRYHVITFPDIAAGGDSLQKVGAFTFSKDTDAVETERGHTDGVVRVYVACAIFAKDVFKNEITTLEHYMPIGDIFGEKAIPLRNVSGFRKKELPDDGLIAQLSQIQGKWLRPNED